MSGSSGSCFCGSGGGGSGGGTGGGLTQAQVEALITNRSQGSIIPIMKDRNVNSFVQNSNSSAPTTAQNMQFSRDLYADDGYSVNCVFRAGGSSNANVAGQWRLRAVQGAADIELMVEDIAIGVNISWFKIDISAAFHALGPGDWRLVADLRRTSAAGRIQLFQMHVEVGRVGI